MKDNETPDVCANGHVVAETGGRDNRGRCRACNRECSRRLVERRKAGIPKDPAKSHPRRDLGMTEVVDAKDWARYEDGESK
jgi:hypothetical protein